MIWPPQGCACFLLAGNATTWKPAMHEVCSSISSQVRRNFTPLPQMRQHLSCVITFQYLEQLTCLQEHFEVLQKAGGQSCLSNRRCNQTLGCKSQLLATLNPSQLETQLGAGSKPLRSKLLIWGEFKELQKFPLFKMLPSSLLQANHPN